MITPAATPTPIPAFAPADKSTCFAATASLDIAEEGPLAVSELALDAGVGVIVVGAGTVDPLGILNVPVAVGWCWRIDRSLFCHAIMYGVCRGKTSVAIAVRSDSNMTELSDGQEPQS